MLYRFRITRFPNIICGVFSMNHRRLKISLPTLLIIVLFLMTACAQRVVYERRTPPPEKREIRKGEPQYGVASWYGADFHGRATSSGQIYDMYQLTCAHQTLPLGTMVMVTNLENGKSLELKVNDRGPFVKERIIDVSYAAARMLGMWEKGTASVKVEVIGFAPELVQRFTLQVGSFVDEINAQKLAEQLRKSFDNVSVTTLETQTQKYHRVRVGQFDTRESALVTAERLSQMGFNVMVTSR
jgi:peptidoglycan lytic transglycosylase